MPVLTSEPAQTVRERSARMESSAPRRFKLMTFAARVLLVLCLLADSTLLLVSLVPQSIWQTHGYPNGPIPHSLTPAVAALFYALPSAVGALCRRWPVAIVLSTLPAWLDLGAFAIAVATRYGPFYLAQDVHAASTVGTLELFAALGAFGWLARTALLAVFKRGDWARR